ncbi:hypothetical protein ACFFX0_09325 [Citricoccus parietis]|uniref:Uncharacterized protein n=1 Tax=Citricoccus parietis TaxID=592307 RepID=A0ABV5FXH8_9MICC
MGPALGEGDEVALPVGLHHDQVLRPGHRLTRDHAERGLAPGAETAPGEAGGEVERQGDDAQGQHDLQNLAETHISPGPRRSRPGWR